MRFSNINLENNDFKRQIYITSNKRTPNKFNTVVICVCSLNMHSRFMLVNIHKNRLHLNFMNIFKTSVKKFKEN